MRTLDDFHGYQHDAVTELYEHETRLAIMPTGAGKTIVSLTAFAELQQDDVLRKGVVIGPPRVALGVWPFEAPQWAHTAHLTVLPVAGAPTRREKLLTRAADLYAVSMNNMKWLLEHSETWAPDDPRFDILIVDEPSKCKNPRGAWAKQLRKLAPRFKMVWLLTGSPRPNSELDYFVNMAVLSRDKVWGRSYDKWRRENFYPTDFQQHNWEVHRHYVDELNSDVARYSFKVPLSAVPRPASDPILHQVQLPAAVREKYNQMERELFARITNKHGEVDIVAFNAAVSTGKLAQMTQGFLYDEEKTAHELHHVKTELLEDLLGENGSDPSAIIYWFKEDLVRLQDLIPGLAYLGAGVSDKRSLELEQEWNAGNLPYLAIHPASAGHGLNLQGTPAQLIHYALTWSAELYDQTIARIARQGYAGGADAWYVLNHHIVCEDTVDEVKMLRVQNKLTAEQAALEYIQSVGGK